MTLRPLRILAIGRLRTPFWKDAAEHYRARLLRWRNLTETCLRDADPALSPAERVAFVLHDLFAVPFEEIAPLIEKTAAATRQLASRARRKVQGQAPAPDPDLGRQRRAVDAFFAAARNGDLDALLAVLDPDVVLRSDGGAGRARHTVVLNGAATVAGQAVLWGKLSPFARPALVNGTAGAVVIGDNGRALSIMAFTVVDGAIAAIDVIVDQERLASFDLSAFRD